MTRWIYTLLFVSMSWMASGQYFPFPTENASWEGSFIGIIGYPIKEHFVICGDTTLNDAITYKKIYQVSIDSSGNVTDQNFISGIKEDAAQKLIWANDGNGAYLLYDFNLDIGDKFLVNTVDTLKVDSIGFTNVSGAMRRTIFFKHSPGFPQEFWIEGIGSNFNLLTRGINLETTADYSPYLECFHENNELLINLFPGESGCDFEFQTTMDCSISTANQKVVKKEIIFELSPNPASSSVRLFIKGKEHIKLDLMIWDIFGRQVKRISPIVVQSMGIPVDQLAPGLYYFSLFDPENNTQTNLKKLIIQR